MDFALCPKIGPPRLIRFGHIGLPDMVSSLDRETNVLMVDKARYDRLPRMQQDMVIKTQHRALSVVWSDGCDPKLVPSQ
jgi:hypothetical protein